MLGPTEWGIVTGVCVGVGELVAVGEMKGCVACATLWLPLPSLNWSSVAVVTVHGECAICLLFCFFSSLIPVTRYVSVLADPVGVRVLFGSTAGLWPG